MINIISKLGSKANILNLIEGIYKKIIMSVPKVKGLIIPSMIRNRKRKPSPPTSAQRCTLCPK